MGDACNCAKDAITGNPRNSPAARQRAFATYPIRKRSTPKNPRKMEKRRVVRKEHPE